MSEQPTAEFATEFMDCAGRYLDQVEAALTYAPMALETYEHDRTTFHQDVRAVARLESACDDLLADCRGLVGTSMQPNFTGVYFRPDAVLDLLVAIDEVVNGIETFLTDLAAIQPDLTFDARRDLLAMAETAAEATTLLVTATERLLDALCRGGDPPAVDAAVTEIGALESRCDDRRTKIVADAFARHETAPALVVHELSSTLDAAVDAVEDAADRLSFVASTVVSLDGHEFADGSDATADGDGRDAPDGPREATGHNR
jgi:uncharacterized protein Yka (UPF0111/DUF47 family)